MTTVEASLLGGRVEFGLLPDALLFTGPEAAESDIWDFASAVDIVTGCREGNDWIGSLERRIEGSGMRG